MNVQKYLQSTSKVIGSIPGYTYQEVRPFIECNSGLKLSVQASRSHYCAPRIDKANFYVEVEVGFPSEKIEELMPFAEREDDPTGTVYGYVPIEIVEAVVEKNGGIKL